MVAHELEKDIFELQTDALGILQTIAYVAWIILLTLSLIVRDFEMLIPMGVTGGLLLLSSLLRHQHKVRIGSWALIIGLAGGPIITCLINGPSLAVFFFFLLPVIASSLLINGKAAIWLAAVMAIAMLALTIPSQGTSLAISTIFAPAMVCLLAGGIAYMNEANILQMVSWALDIQQKDTQRAEMFYKQGEELKQALLEIQHAHGALERLNNELKVAHKKTEEASKAKSTFLSNMSHELRTPLNVIIGYTSSMLNMPQMYQDVPLPSVYRGDIALIKENGHYLVGLINDILDLSKIEAGRLELHREVISLPEIFRGVVATATGLIKDKPLTIRPDFPEDLPPVDADPMRVRQIILNLMSNAIKFTQSGSVTLQARLTGSNVTISVIDTGIGIPETALDHIFDRFEQAEHDTDKRYGGTGLGLDIAKQLSRMHGGDLTVQSVVGLGSNFTFTLPVATEEMEKPTAPQMIQGSVAILEPTAEQETALQTRTILLVEDEVVTRDMIRRTLESAGHVVVETPDGGLAQEMAAGLLPDLIILDVQLPNMDGWQILEALKTSPDTASVPVVVCTALEGNHRAKELGAALYLPKPVSPSDLLQQIETLFKTSLEPEGN